VLYKQRDFWNKYFRDLTKIPDFAVEMAQISISAEALPQTPLRHSRRSKGPADGWLWRLALITLADVCSRILNPF